MEVADAALNFDLTTKSDLYARAGIVEYWVLNVPARRVIVHWDPVSGKYGTILIYSEQESVAPLAAPQAMFPVRTAFAE